jgi:hypothetical protein
MRRRREDCHLHADLGDQDLRRPLVHAGDRVQAIHLLGKRGDHLVDVRTQRLDHFVEVVEVGEHLSDEKGVMGAKAPGQGLPERRKLFAELAARQVGHDVGIGRALRQGGQHRAS